MAKMSISNPIQYLKKRETGDIFDISTKLFDKRFNAAKNLYKQDLVCHYGCVNAIEFSDNGELLVSGGDDRRVMLWHYNEAIFGYGYPIPMNNQHMSNIFCLAITHDNHKIFSGGNDDQVIVHDLEKKCAIEVLNHQRAVCGLALNPFNEHILATAGNDGRLLIFDTRLSVDESLVVSRSRKAFHAVKFHPIQSDIIVSANARDGAALWDLRSTKHPTIRYAGSNGTSQNCMSVCFDSAGSRILALRRRLPPALYSTYEAEPQAQFYHPDYYNSCTMKSACFVGDRDQYVLSGSDDFNLYMWKSPVKGGWVDSTHMVLYGHRSIVNQVRYNPRLGVIASSGVEKIIKTWSPIQYPGFEGSLLSEGPAPENARDVFSHEQYVSLVHHTGQYISHNYSEQSTTEDPRMMAFFDSLVQREMEGWTGEDTDSHSDSTSQPDQGVSTPAHAHTHTHTHALRSKDSDSSDSDTIIVHLLPLPPKRATNGIRTQRYPARIARIVPSRQSKRATQKRGISRRSKQTRGTTTKTLKGVKAGPCVSRKGKCAGGWAGRRSTRLAPAPTLHTTHTSHNTHTTHTSHNTHNTLSTADSERTDSDEPDCRQFRNTGKIIRPLRRRMNLSRSLKRKKTATVHRKMDANNGTAVVSSSQTNGDLGTAVDSGDALALPSTSSGFRGHNNLFRIAEVDSDDDQSVGSPKSPGSLATQERPPLLNIVPTPLNGSRDNICNALHIDIPQTARANNTRRTNAEMRQMHSRHMTLRRSSLGSRYRNGRLTLRHSDSSESPPIKHYNNNNLENINGNERTDSNEDTHRPVHTETVTRLMNETNESELESSCSTNSAIIYPTEIISPIRQRKRLSPEAATPDSGIFTGPCSSTGSLQSHPSSGNGLNLSRHVLHPNDENSDEPEWTTSKHRQRVKKARRNYRNNFGDSDSN